MNPKEWPSRQKKRITFILTDEDYDKWWNILRSLEEQTHRRMTWEDVADYVMEELQRCAEREAATAQS